MSDSYEMFFFDIEHIRMYDDDYDDDDDFGEPDLWFIYTKTRGSI